jgi:hypothetical protein
MRRLPWLQMCEYGLTQSVPAAVANQLLGLDSTPAKRLERSVTAAAAGPAAAASGAGQTEHQPHMQLALHVDSGPAHCGTPESLQQQGFGGPPDRQRMIEDLLQRNAMLLQRL